MSLHFCFFHLLLFCINAHLLFIREPCTRQRKPIIPSGRTIDNADMTERGTEQSHHARPKVVFILITDLLFLFLFSLPSAFIHSAYRTPNRSCSSRSAQLSPTISLPEPLEEQRHRLRITSTTSPPSAP